MQWVVGAVITGFATFIGFLTWRRNSPRVRVDLSRSDRAIMAIGTNVVGWKTLKIGVTNLAHTTPVRVAKIEVFERDAGLVMNRVDGPTLQHPIPCLASEDWSVKATYLASAESVKAGQPKDVRAKVTLAHGKSAHSKWFTLGDGDLTD